jgi:urea transport system ATP-binding protein
MFSISNLTAGYSDETAAIHNINLSIPKNEIGAVIGSNGAGKTTLLKSIMGLINSSEGDVKIEGSSISGLSSEERARLGIAYVPQGRLIFPYLTVEENLLLGCEIRKMNTNQAKEIAYSFFPALAGIKQRKGGMLSGGQQQQLAIARMLVVKPKLLLLDEPAEGIQPNVVQEIGRILKKVSTEMNITVLLVEQFVGFALNLAQSYYYMQGGEILKNGVINDGNRKEVMESIKL